MCQYPRRQPDKSTRESFNLAGQPPRTSQHSDTMPSADQQHHLNLDGLQSLSISAPDVPSPPYDHRTTMTIRQDEQHQPATHWPQDIWLHSPSYRVLYQPVLVVPHHPQPDHSSPLQQPDAGANVPDAPLHDLSQEGAPEGNPAAERYQPNGHTHAGPKGDGR